MNRIYLYIFTSFLIFTAINAKAQNSYFFNQKNLFSIHISMNPRLVPMSQDNKSTGVYETTNPGIGRGTYYQYYNDKNKLIGGNEKVNVMLNTSYGRLFGGNKIIGVEFNYQKHYLTMSKNANTGDVSTNEEGDFLYEEGYQPFLVSSPVFNVFDFQVFMDIFLEALHQINISLPLAGGLGYFLLMKNKTTEKMLPLLIRT